MNPNKCVRLEYIFRFIKNDFKSRMASFVNYKDLEITSRNSDIDTQVTNTHKNNGHSGYTRKIPRKKQKNHKRISVKYQINFSAFYSLEKTRFYFLHIRRTNRAAEKKKKCDKYKGNFLSFSSNKNQRHARTFVAKKWEEN